MSEQNTFIIDVDVKPLKAQLKDATKELQSARQKFGEFSNEAINAAKKVGAIKDAIEDAKEASDLFDPGKRFQALTTAASTAAAGVSAVQGAMALFGGESEDVAKTLQKVQGAMALSQGLSQLKDIGKVGEQLKLTFKGLTTGMSTFKKALISTGVGALVAGLGLLIANFDEVKKVINNLFPGLAKFGSMLQNLTQSFTDFIGVTKKADRDLETFNKNNKLRNEQLEREIKVLEAAGGKEAEIAAKKKQMSANELEALKKKVDDKGKLYGEDAKKYKDLNADMAAIDAAESKRLADKSKEEAEKAKQQNEKKLQLAKEQQGKVNEAEKILREANAKLKGDQEREILAVEEQYAEKRKKLAEAGIKDNGDLAKAEAEEKKKITDKYNKEEADKKIEFEKQLASIVAETKLAGIKDENEKAKQELINSYIEQRAEIDANEKLTSEQKTALKIALSEKENADLDALKLTQEQKKAEQDIADLNKLISKNAEKFNLEKELLDKKDALLKQSFENGLINEKAYNEGVAENSEARIAIDAKEKDAKIENAKKISALLSGLSDVIGKETAAGKAFAIASATIDTYLAAQKAYQSMVGIPIVGPALGAVAAGVAVAGGIKNVKAIMSVKTPAGGGGGGGGAAPSPQTAPAVSPQMPTIGTSPITALETTTKQTPIKAYVVESDVTSSQKRVSDIERRAGF